MGKKKKRRNGPWPSGAGVPGERIPHAGGGGAPPGGPLDGLRDGGGAPGGSAREPHDPHRVRLAHTLRAAQSLHDEQGETVAGLPALLTTLGVGQVLALLARKDPAGVGPYLVSWLSMECPAIAGTRAGEVLDSWRGLADRRVVAELEESAVAWAADLKLMASLVAADEHDDPEGPEGGARELPGVPPPWRDRRACAVREAFALEPYATRAQSLPFEILHHGLVRALAILARESVRRDPRRSDGSVPDAIALSQSVRRRLSGFPGGNVPMKALPLAKQLLDPASQALARALEEEALAWASAVKTFAAALKEVPA